ncbi:MAG: RAMP superfamily CRISPR-associated protein [Bacteroidia bacterium]
MEGYQGGRQQQGQRDNRDSGGKLNDPARAPYNFVPLNEKVVSAEPGVDFDSFAEGRLSGYIDLSIETLTPMFIRGNKENLLNPNGQLILQGSSIRGLLRGLVEICSCAKFKADHQFEDRRMYFRAMADMAIRLRNDYKNEIVDGVEAGYLRYNKQNRSYSIQPAQGFDRVTSSGRFKYKKSREGIEVHSGSMPGKNQNWIVFPPDNSKDTIEIAPKLIKAYEGDDNRSEQAFDVLKLARKGKSSSIDFPDGVPVFFKQKNRMVTSFGHTRNYRLPYAGTVADHVPERLKSDQISDIAESIFGKSGDDQNQILAGRVFFEDTAPRRMSDVETRLAALKILGNPKATTFQHYLQQPDGINTAKEKLAHWGDKRAAIRGFKQYWHRANPERPNQKLWTEENLVFKKQDIETWVKSEEKAKKTWTEAKFNLKVEKDANEVEKVRIEGDINLLPDGLRSILTAYYNLDGATTKRLNITKPQNSIVNLVLENERFDAKIRFENLTEIELGALLFVLQLPEGCAHKLGMGKSLGLGSVKIVPKLRIINHSSRYESLFDKDGQWQTGISEENSLEDYKNAFAAYVGKKTSRPQIDSADAYWSQDDRMEELRHMLKLTYASSDAGNWQAKTRYMQLPEFRSRPVLPKPSEVVKDNTYENP